MAEEKTLTTKLNRWHHKHGAKMSCFCGYEMPLWYQAGAKEEHLTVLQRAGLFDTSHMAMIMVEGPDSFDLLQDCFSKDLRTCVGTKKKPLVPGRCVYGVFLAPHGYVIDDAIVCQLDVSLYLVCVNASMGQSISSHLEDEKGNRNVAIIDLTGQLAKIDVQGPASAKVLQKVLRKPQEVFSGFSYFSCKGHFNPASRLADAVRLTDNTPLLLTRSGFTGEFGFEIFVGVDHIQEIWKNILDSGKSLGLVPCGLAARDSLRVGAVLPLSHQDIGNWPFVNNPWQFALPYTEDHAGFTKHFLGDAALLGVKHAPFTYAFAGFDPRKVERGEHTQVVDAADKKIGSVLTCVTDMGIDRINQQIVSITSPDKPEDFKPRGLGCGFIKVKKELHKGDIVYLLGKRRKLRVEIVDDIRPYRTARLPIETMI